MTLACATAGAFESCVISEGTQAATKVHVLRYAFESCVISEGTQAPARSQRTTQTFESCVISEGTQAALLSQTFGLSLRAV